MREPDERRGRSAAQAAALPFGFARASRALPFQDWRQWLAGCARQEVEQRRLFPWIAVAFGFGILLFFAADFIAANARLLPPPEAARPGGYDFARDAYFRGIGAVGSLTGQVEARAPPTLPDFALRLAAAIDQARNGLTPRIADAIGGQAGAVAAALVTGKRGLIDEDTNEALRAAGIYHIVSISGLHMVLAAGTMFWLARTLLSLSSALALLWPWFHLLQRSPPFIYSDIPRWSKHLAGDSVASSFPELPFWCLPGAYPVAYPTRQT